MSETFSLFKKKSRTKMTGKNIEPKCGTSIEKAETERRALGTGDPIELICDSCGARLGGGGGTSEFFAASILCSACKQREAATPAIRAPLPFDATPPPPWAGLINRPATVRNSTYVTGQLGLFTARRVLEGELLAYFSGDDSGPIEGDPDHASDRAVGEGNVWEDGGTDDARQIHVGCFANTARSEKYYNAALRRVRPSSKALGRYGVVALRDILKGCEVVVDYGKKYWKPRGGIEVVDDPLWEPDIPPPRTPEDEEVVPVGGTKTRPAEEAAAAKKRKLLPRSAREDKDSPEVVEAAITALVAEMRRQRAGGSARILVFTGAGMSTASGVPDYRGEKGAAVSTERKETGAKLAPRQSRETLPSVSHMALAALVRSGWARAVITMNIDELDLRAGVPRNKLVEFHGSAFVERCPECKAAYRRNFDVRPADRKRGRKTGRRCDDCGADLVDAVVPMNGLIDRDTYELVDYESSRATMAIVLGSSLLVSPMLELTVTAAEKFGVLCTLGEVKPEVGSVFKLRARTDVNAFLAALAEKLGVEIPEYDPSKEPHLPDRDPVGMALISAMAAEQGYELRPVKGDIFDALDSLLPSTTAPSTPPGKVLSRAVATALGRPWPPKAIPGVEYSPVDDESVLRSLSEELFGTPIALMLAERLDPIHPFNSEGAATRTDSIAGLPAGTLLLAFHAGDYAQVVERGQRQQQSTAPQPRDIVDLTEADSL